MTILVTGGTVFASRFIAEHFTMKGHIVYVINRNTRPQSNGVNLIECDRHNLGDKLKKLHFDLVLDVTAYNEFDVSSLVSSLGSFDKYIFISSSTVYPETLSQPFTEEQRCGVNTYWGDYGVNKLEAERYLLENVEDLYIIRPPYLYGPMNNLYREAFVFECAEMNLPFYVPNDGKMPLQFFHIEDLCRFIEAIVDKSPKQKIFNVGNSEIVDINKWVNTCYKVLGKIPEIRYMTGHNQRSYFSFLDYGYVLDIAKQKTLMSETKPLIDGLRESYEWYKNNKELVRRKDYLKYIEENFNNESC